MTREKATGIALGNINPISNEVMADFSPQNTKVRTKHLGRVVQKPVNVNPGLKVNRRVDFSCIKMIFTAYVLCSLRLFKLKTEEQTI